ncbi:MAG: hypothetical protein HQK54_16515, partial [Oligoflexales bacterium]|nr:hypothetical protein [Oligoflexales bacterium]
MRRRFEQALLTIRILTDQIMILIAWILSYYIRFHSGMPIPLGVPSPVLYFKLMPFIVVIWFAVFQMLGFYKRTDRHHSPLVEALDIIQCCIGA